MDDATGDIGDTGYSDRYNIMMEARFSNSQHLNIIMAGKDPFEATWRHGLLGNSGEQRRYLRQAPPGFAGFAGLSGLRYGGSA